MFEVKMPREIKAYKEKIALGLTLRQIICITLALMVGVPLYFWGRHYIPEDLLSWLVILIGFLLGGMGFIKLEGKTLEKYLYVMLKFTFSYDQKRKYRSESILERSLEKEYAQTYQKFIEANKKKG